MATFQGLPNQAQQNNPLSKYFRQPAIYFTLPSRGKWWSGNALTQSATGELAVYPMTSKDEILLRTPDALINGQGMVDVIQSCIPDIKDAWKMPSPDVDATLIAMRIASYGHNMDFEGTCPKCEEANTYSLDLRTMLERIKSPDFDKEFELDTIKIKFKPLIYFGMNQTNKANFEIQRLAQSIDQMPDNDEKKVNEAVTQMGRIVDLNSMVLADSTDTITIMNPDGSEAHVVREKNYILDFYKNIDARTIELIQAAYQEIAREGTVPPQQTSCTHCGAEYEMEITFDYANFFVRAS